jgi:hypothetical protein
MDYMTSLNVMLCTSKSLFVIVLESLKSTFSAKKAVPNKKFVCLVKISESTFFFFSSFLTLKTIFPKAIPNKL